MWWQFNPKHRRRDRQTSNVKLKGWNACVCSRYFLFRKGSIWALHLGENIHCGHFLWDDHMELRHCRHTWWFHTFSVSRGRNFWQQHKTTQHVFVTRILTCLYSYKTRSLPLALNWFVYKNSSREIAKEGYSLKFWQGWNLLFKAGKFESYFPESFWISAIFLGLVDRYRFRYRLYSPVLPGCFWQCPCG